MKTRDKILSTALQLQTPPHPTGRHNTQSPPQIPGPKVIMDELRRSIAEVLRHIYDYRFIYIHFVTIARRIPDVKRVYGKRFSLRREQFLRLFQIFRHQGVFRNDIPDPIWENLIRSIYAIGDFWISVNELSTGLPGKKAVDYYTNLISDLFYPYLTKKGTNLLS